MADFYGVHYTEGFITKPPSFPDPSDSGGRVRILRDTYEADGEVQNSRLFMGGLKLPANARIVDYIMSADALGTSTAIQLIRIDSDGTTETAISAAITSTSATFTRATLIAQIQHQNTSGAEQVIAVDVTGSGAVTGTIVVEVFYVID